MQDDGCTQGWMLSCSNVFVPENPSRCAARSTLHPPSSPGPPEPFTSAAPPAGRLPCPTTTQHVATVDAGKCLTSHGRPAAGTHQHDGVLIVSYARPHGSHQRGRSATERFASSVQRSRGRKAQRAVKNSRKNPPKKPRTTV